MLNLESVGKDINFSLTCSVVIVFCIGHVGNQSVTVSWVIERTSSCVFDNPITYTTTATKIFSTLGNN